MSANGVARKVVIASRGSPLALEQTNKVRDLLLKAAAGQERYLDVSIAVVQSQGDQDKSSTLREMGQGAFTQALDTDVAEGRADLAVHSLKDASVRVAAGLVLAACLQRGDPRDALIVAPGCSYKSLADLPPGSRVGTGSTRRRAQILYAHPHLKVVPIRGSVEARLKLIDDKTIDATVLAYAGLQRLGKEALAASVLSTDDMVPAACQGIIGVMCREDDYELRELLRAMDDEAASMEATAERACLGAVLPESGEAAALPDMALAVHTGYSPTTRCIGLDCVVGDPQGKELFRYTELSRRIRPGNLEDARRIGEEYGALLKRVAEQKGWVQPSGGTNS